MLGAFTFLLLFFYFLFTIEFFSNFVNFLLNFKLVATVIASWTVKFPCSWLSCIMYADNLRNKLRFRSEPFIVTLPSIFEVLKNIKNCKKYIKYAYK